VFSKFLSDLGEDVLVPNDGIRQLIVSWFEGEGGKQQGKNTAAGGLKLLEDSKLSVNASPTICEPITHADGWEITEDAR